MGKNSGIAWTDHTFSPWWGCVEVSPACDHCYAREWDSRFSEKGKAHWGKEQPRKFFGDRHWNAPRTWNKAAQASGKRTLVFCASMADVFETGRLDLHEHRERLWKLIEETPALTWLLLTKRPHSIRKLLPQGLVGAPNVWLGTTVEGPGYLWRAAALCENHRAVVRFLSMEPLLGETPVADYLSQKSAANPIDAHKVDWVIAGCESGKASRPTETGWYRRIRDECEAQGVPFFLKQARRGAEGITSGGSSWIKLPGSIIEQPCLDSTQHVEFPR